MKIYGAGEFEKAVENTFSEDQSVKALKLTLKVFDKLFKKLHWPLKNNYVDSTFPALGWGGPEISEEVYLDIQEDGSELISMNEAVEIKNYSRKDVRQGKGISHKDAYYAVNKLQQKVM